MTKYFCKNCGSSNLDTGLNCNDCGQRYLPQTYQGELMTATYLYSTIDGEQFFQMHRDPLPEDIKTISDGQNIFKFEDGKFMRMNEKGEFVDVQEGITMKDEGIEWSTTP